MTTAADTLYQAVLQLPEGDHAELDRAIANIGEFPDRYPRHSHGTRVYLLRCFPYLVVYKEYPELVKIVAIAHGRRKPGYWKRRLKK